MERFSQALVIKTIIPLALILSTSLIIISLYFHRGNLKFEFEIKEDEYRIIRNEILEASGGIVRILVFEFESTEWKGSLWTHRLIYLEPKPLRSRLTLIITGGFGNDPNETFGYILESSSISGIPVAIITRVPNVDDSLFYSSNLEAIEMGDPKRSLLYPMAQAYIKAMSLVERVASRSPSGFVISGGSKRGWAAWIAARHDPRVVALVPRSFNIADLTLIEGAQLDAYGKLSSISSWITNSENSADFLEEYNLVSWIDEVKEKPVLVVMGTNDDIFPPGLESTYEDFLESFHIVYIPNATHSGVHGLSETWSIVFSFVKLVEDGKEWPEVEINVSSMGNSLMVEANFSRTPESYKLIYGKPSRVGKTYSDYTRTKWKSLDIDTSRYILESEGPIGIFVLAEYKYGKMKFTSSSRIVTHKVKVPSD